MLVSAILRNPYAWLVLGLMVLFIYGFGHVQGAASVQAKWDKETNERNEAALKKQTDIDKAANAARDKIAKQQARIKKLEGELKDEIRLHYGTCTAGDDLVRLWKEKYLPYADIPE